MRTSCPVSPSLWISTSTPVSVVNASNVPSDTQKESWVTSVTVRPLAGSGPVVALIGTVEEPSPAAHAPTSRTVNRSSTAGVVVWFRDLTGSPFAGITQSRFGSGRQHPRLWRSLPSQPGTKAQAPRLIVAVEATRCRPSGSTGTTFLMSRDDSTQADLVVTGVRVPARLRTVAGAGPAAPGRHRQALPNGQPR
jgi:hypothetical protein